MTKHTLGMSLAHWSLGDTWVILKYNISKEEEMSVMYMKTDGWYQVAGVLDLHVGSPVSSCCQTTPRQYSWHQGKGDHEFNPSKDLWV